MKYLILALSIYLAVSCDVKNQSSNAESTTAIENVAEATTKKEMSIAETAAELKADVEEKAQMAKDKMDDAKDAICLLYTSPSPRDKRQSRMPSSA